MKYLVLIEPSKKAWLFKWLHRVHIYVYIYIEGFILPTYVGILEKQF